MEQNKSTISLTFPPDSDLGIVEQFVIDRRYIPSDLLWNQYVATILLYYEDYLEGEELIEEEMPLVDWLSEFDMNYRMEDFDYE